MRAEQAEGWLLAHPGRVRTGMKKQITVMSMKATICIWRCQITVTFISFLLLSSHHLCPIYSFVSCSSPVTFPSHFFFLLLATSHYTGLIFQKEHPIEQPGEIIKIKCVMSTEVRHDDTATLYMVALTVFNYLKYFRDTITVIHTKQVFYFFYLVLY